MQDRKSKLLKLIHEKAEKLAKAKPASEVKRRKSLSTRAESNRANGQNSTGPKSQEGKTRASANSLKHGFFASADRLNSAESTCKSPVENSFTGEYPDGPAEEQLIRELAMFRARLICLEAAEYALLCSEIETNPNAAREIAAARRDSYWGQYAADSPLDRAIRTDVISTSPCARRVPGS